MSKHKADSPSVRQLPLPWEGGTTFYGHSLAKKRRVWWYYIKSTREQTMLALAEDGTMIWIAADTVNFTPHLFASLLLARMCIRDNKFKAQAVRYEWKVD